MLAFFADPSKTTLIFLAVLLILGLLFRNFWCRFLCPYGALMGIASVISPFKIKRDASACTDCLKCTDACPSGIEVHKKNTVRSIECVGCHDCVRVRSNENCLKSNIANPKAAAFMIVIIATIAMIAAKLCGYWYSDVSGETYAYWLERLGQLTH
jgi:polyferredoxin